MKSVILLNVYVFEMFVFPPYIDYSRWTSSSRPGSFACCTLWHGSSGSVPEAYGPAVTESGSTRLANQRGGTSARVGPNEHFLQQQNWPNRSQRAPSTSHWFFFDFHPAKHGDYHMGQALEHHDSSYCGHSVYFIFRTTITTNSGYFSK